MGIRRHFTAHPASIGETYGEHLRHAGGFAWALARASGACALHAVVPSLCERTASTAVTDLHRRMTQRVTIGGADGGTGVEEPVRLAG